MESDEQDTSQIGCIRSVNSCIAYVVGDAGLACRAEQKVFDAIRTGMVFEKDATAVEVPDGAVFYVHSHIGAGASSVHRLGERLVLCEPPVGALGEERESGDTDIPEDAELRLKRAMLEAVPEDALPIAIFDVTSGRLALIYANYTENNLAEAVKKVDDGRSHASIEWDSETSHGVVAAVPNGRYAVFARFIELNGLSHYCLGVWQSIEAEAWYVVEVV